jgi:NAD(P)-dependent dehydrogenase (short-subunit alcohol dehydrogenase family)
VIELDKRGWQVFAGVRSEADGERLRAQASPRLVPLRLDVTDEACLAAAAQCVGETVGPAGLAGLVNNAGIVVAGPLELLPLAELRKQFEVNVIGQVATTQAFLPLVRKAKGRIVNMGSFNGRITSPYLGPYAASKHAMEAISDALRIELRTWGIQVSLIEPCSIATPIWEKSFAAADNLASSAEQEKVALYEDDLEALRKATQKLADNALPVDRVVQAVVHALTSRRPKTRYPVGLETHLAFRLHKWTPDRLWDRLIKGQLGLR